MTSVSRILRLCELVGWWDFFAPGPREQAMLPGCGGVRSATSLTSLPGFSGRFDARTMSAPPLTATQRMSRQMQAAMHLKRRYETLFDKPISITSLRKDPELLSAVRIEVARSGDTELQHLLDVAFADEPGEFVLH